MVPTWKWYRTLHLPLHLTRLLYIRNRWDDDNGPEQTDLVSNRNLIAATPRGIQRFVFATSTGVERYNQFPFVILNLFGARRLRHFWSERRLPGVRRVFTLNSNAPSLY